VHKEEALDIILESGVVAVMRAKSSSQLIAAADAIKKGGVRAIEVTMTTPGALGVIAEAKARYGSDVAFGAGTILDTETGRAAILAGADFIVAPTLNLDVLKLCNRYGIASMPGCFSPTEILTAWEGGADLVKLFPVSVGGPELIKAVLAPLPHVKLVAVGGVDLSNAADYIRKGAVALGVGSDLVSQKLLDAGDMDEITRRAAAFVEQVKKGRGLS